MRPESDWTVVEDRADFVQLAYFLDDVGSAGYNVGLLVVEPHGVYDPVLEGRSCRSRTTSSAGSRTTPTSKRANPSN